MACGEDPTGSCSAELMSQEQDNPSAASEQGLDELLRKLERIESTENVLEQILNTENTDNIDIDALIAQLPLLGSTEGDARFLGGGDEAPENSQRSISSEIASIQKLIDEGGGGGGDGDTSVSISVEHSEVAGGNASARNNNVCGNSARSFKGYQSERDIDDVLWEYEEFERSLSQSQASAVDESFRSDVPPLSTHSTKGEDEVEQVATSVSTPVIKPPVLKTVVTGSPPVKLTPSSPPPVTSAHSNPNDDNKMPKSTKEIYCPPDSGKSSSHDKSMQSARTRPITAHALNAKKPSETKHPTSNPTSKASQSAHHGLASPRQGTQLRGTSSATTATGGGPNSGRDIKDNATQDAFRPRRRHMISPRRTPHNPFTNIIPADIKGGAGDGEERQHKNQAVSQGTDDRAEYAVMEALKTIEKLNSMVSRQETLLEAYSTDNERLWTELKETKGASQEREVQFEDVINSLKTEVATLKLNRLVVSSQPPSESTSNKAELLKLREDSEVKAQQLLELRKQVLVLQSKLDTTEKSRPPVSAKATVESNFQNIVSEEKEKEYQKSINALNKQVRTLQKILYSRDPTAPPPPTPWQAAPVTGANRPRPLQRAKSDMTKQPLAKAVIQSGRNVGVDSVATGLHSSPLKLLTPRGETVKLNLNTVFSKINKGVELNSSKVLQASLNCLEQEREEFDNVVMEKNKLLLEKEKMILELQEEVETLRRQYPDGDVVERGFVDELRSRIITQNGAIQTLKEHLSVFKQVEAENFRLREEKEILEQRAIELKRKLDFAQHLGKPENEVLCHLSEKVDELNSRYFHRERQLDTLLNRLTLKTTVGLEGGGLSTSSSSSGGGSGRGPTNLSPQRIPLGQFTNNQSSLGGALTFGRKGRSSGFISADILHIADISPTNSIQLYSAIQDLPEM